MIVALVVTPRCFLRVLTVVFGFDEEPIKKKAN